MSKFGVYRGKDKNFARRYASGGFIANIQPLGGGAYGGGQSPQTATNAGTFSSPATKQATAKPATAPTTPPPKTAPTAAPPGTFSVKTNSALPYENANGNVLGRPGGL